MAQDFHKCSVLFGVYVKLNSQQKLLLVCVYVDDLMVIGDEEAEIERFKENKIQLIHCNTEEQIANIFTKPLRQHRFEKLRNMLGLKQLDNLD